MKGKENNTMTNPCIEESIVRSYLEGRRWKNGAKCPVCGGVKNITTRKREGFYRCNPCKEDFTVRTGTIFERSHIPLRKWVTAIRFMCPQWQSLSTRHLSDHVGVTQRTAARMIRQLRKACGISLETWQGVDSIVHEVLGYRPKLKTAASKKRARKQLGIRRLEALAKKALIREENADEYVRLREHSRWVGNKLVDDWPEGWSPEDQEKFLKRLKVKRKKEEEAIVDITNAIDAGHVPALDTTKSEKGKA